jgi:hypothetical protein
MKGWMISARGSAVNLAQVVRVSAQKRAVGETWYVWAHFQLARCEQAGVALTADLDSREAAAAWIAEHFGETS